MQELIKEMILGRHKQNIFCLVSWQTFGILMQKSQLAFFFKY
uniref:Uncharacterized protein n=1 Tax=Anguilla anguilla TaxID=7936 RepID=A0A0E9R135_ANGAN